MTGRDRAAPSALTTVLWLSLATPSPPPLVSRASFSLPRRATRSSASSSRASRLVPRAALSPPLARSVFSFLGAPLGPPQARSSSASVCARRLRVVVKPPNPYGTRRLSLMALVPRVWSRTACVSPLCPCCVQLSSSPPPTSFWSFLVGCVTLSCHHLSLSPGEIEFDEFLLMMQHQDNKHATEAAGQARSVWSNRFCFVLSGPEYF